MIGVEECRRSLARHGKSFALASIWLDRERRDAAASLYAWCRRADDAVDLPGGISPSDALGALRGELADVYGGLALDRGLEPFRQTILRYRIPRSHPEALIDGLEMDVRGTRYADLPQLLTYCGRVAGAVGLMMAPVLGLRDAQALARAAHLGVAMQLTNICRDVLADWRRGRLYVPRDLIARCGAAGVEPDGSDAPPPATRRALAAATACLLDEADRWYASADAGIRALPFRSAITVRTARAVYARIGDVVRRHGCDPCAGRAVVSTGAKLRLAIASFAREARGLPRRAWIADRAAPPSFSCELDDVIRL